MATPAQIVTCPHCSARVRAPADALGRRARCARCGKAFILSAAPATAQQPAAASPSPGASPPAALRLAGEGPATPTQAPPAAQAQQVPTHPCPACRALVPEGAVLCTNCGTHLRSGRRLLTKSRGHVGDEAEDIRSWVNGLSLLLPLAIVPYRTTIPQLRSRRANTILVVATCVLSIAGLMSILNDRYEILTETEGLARRRVSVLFQYGLWPGEHFAPIQLVSHLFLHGGLVHLVGNMLFLWMFGAAVNSVLGWKWYPALYLVLGALAGYLGHVVFGPHDVETPLIGASGAVCGLTGLYLVLFPRHDIHMAVWFRFAWWTRARIKTFAVTGIYAVLFFTAFDVAALLLGWTGSVAHAVHISGFLCGVLFGIVFLLTGFVKSEGYDLLSWILGDRWRFGRARLGPGIERPEPRR